MQTFAEPLNPKKVRLLAGASDGVGCFEEDDPEAVEVDSPLIDDPVKVG